MSLYNTGDGGTGTRQCLGSQEVYVVEQFLWGPYLGEPGEAAGLGVRGVNHRH